MGGARSVATQRKPPRLQSASAVQNSVPLHASASRVIGNSRYREGIAAGERQLRLDQGHGMGPRVSATPPFAWWDPRNSPPNAVEQGSRRVLFQWNFPPGKSKRQFYYLNLRAASGRWIVTPTNWGVRVKIRRIVGSLLALTVGIIIACLAMAALSFTVHVHSIGRAARARRTPAALRRIRGELCHRRCAGWVPTAR